MSVDSEESLPLSMAKSVSPHDKSLKNDSSEQAVPTTKRVRFEVPDNFFDSFGHDSAEEDDSIQNLDSVTITPLWWFESCEEISCSSESNSLDNSFFESNFDHGEDGVNGENGYGPRSNQTIALKEMTKGSSGQIDVPTAFVLLATEGNEENYSFSREHGNDDDNTDNTYNSGDSNDSSNDTNQADDSSDNDDEDFFGSDTSNDDDEIEEEQLDSDDDEEEEDSDDEYYPPPPPIEYHIGGEDRVARLPGQPPGPPPEGEARERYLRRMNQSCVMMGPGGTLGQYFLHWREKEWNDWLESQPTRERERQYLNKESTNLLEGASLSVLYSNLLEHPGIVARGGRELAQMVKANAERRNDNSNIERLLLDSASTIHTARNRRGMTNLVPCNKAVDAADKGRSYVREMGTRKFQPINKHGEPENVIIGMEETHILEGFMNDLVSLPLLLRKGCSVRECTADLISIQLPNTPHFHKCMEFHRAEDGLFYMDILPLEVEQANSNQVADSSTDDNESSGDDNSSDDETNDDTDDHESHDDDNSDESDSDKDRRINSNHGKEKKNNSNSKTTTKLEPIDINRAHELCNHPGETKLKETARVFGWKLTGVLKSCPSCAKSKATAKAVPKTTSDERKATTPGEILHLDTTGPYKRTRGKNRYWVAIKDAYTSRVWSEFGEAKNGFTEKIDLILTDLKTRGYSTKYLRLDNAGEWVWLKPVCAKHGIANHAIYSAEHATTKCNRRARVSDDQEHGLCMSAGKWHE